MIFYFLFDGAVHLSTSDKCRPIGRRSDCGCHIELGTWSIHLRVSAGLLFDTTSGRIQRYDNGSGLPGVSGQHKQFL